MIKIEYTPLRDIKLISLFAKSNSLIARFDAAVNLIHKFLNASVPFHPLPSFL